MNRSILALLAGIALAGCASNGAEGLAAANTQPSTVWTIPDWSLGEADLMYSAGAPPVVIGAVSADGTVEMRLPESVEPTQSLAMIFGCNGAPTVTLSDPEASYEITPSALLVGSLADKKRFGYASVANTPEMAKSRLFPSDPMVPGKYYQWMYTPSAASVVGECSSDFYVDQETPTKVTTIYDMNMQPGWSIIEVEIKNILTTPEGMTFPGNHAYRTVDTLPSETVWMFTDD